MFCCHSFFPHSQIARRWNDVGIRFKTILTRMSSLCMNCKKQKAKSNGRVILPPFQRKAVESCESIESIESAASKCKPIIVRRRVTDLNDREIVPVLQSIPITLSQSNEINKITQSAIFTAFSYNVLQWSQLEIKLWIDITWCSPKNGFVQHPHHDCTCLWQLAKSLLLPVSISLRLLRKKHTHNAMPSWLLCISKILCSLHSK